MDAILLSTTGGGIEDSRWHLVNYILDQGSTVFHYPLTIAGEYRDEDDPGRLRPGANGLEFGIVVFDDGFYGFQVDPMSGYKDGMKRTMSLVVGSMDSDDLVSRVEFLKKDLSIRNIEFSEVPLSEIPNFFQKYLASDRP